MRRWNSLVLTSWLVIPVVMTAQETRGSVALSGGKGTDVTGVSASAVTLAPSLITGSASQSFTLSGNASRFSNSAWSMSAGAGLATRLAESSIAPTLDLGATAATTSYSLSYAMADATPALEGRWRAGDGLVRLFGGAHLVASSISRPTAATQSFGGVIPQSNTTTSATGVAGLFGATLSMNAADGERIDLSYRGERGRVAGAMQTDNTVASVIANGGISLAASLGMRQAVDGSQSFGSGSLTISMTPALALQLAAGRYPSNRMLGVPAGDYLNLGAVIQLRPSRPTLPKATGVPDAERGITRLSIRADDADVVEVAGEFNQWQFVRATRAANGVWFADLRIPPGQYRYAFRVNGREWRIPEGAAPAEDEFGGKSAWLTVERTNGRPRSE